MSHLNGACETCRFCIGNVMDTSGKCNIVKDPLRGTPLSLPYARMDTWNGYTMPCGYEGKLWQAKDGV